MPPPQTPRPQNQNFSYIFLGKMSSRIWAQPPSSLRHLLRPKRDLTNAKQVSRYARFGALVEKNKISYRKSGKIREQIRI